MALQVRYYLVMKNVLEPDREKEVWRVLFEISSVAHTKKKQKITLQL